MAASLRLEELDELLAEFQPGRHNLLPALHKIQHHYGYIPREAMNRLARKLGITPAHVFGAVSFYAELRTSPPPEYEIGWCSGPACRLGGSERIRDALRGVLGIDMYQKTPDGKVGLWLFQCNGTCDLAPLLRVNGRDRRNVSVSEAVKLARDLLQGKVPE